MTIPFVDNPSKRLYTVSMRKDRITVSCRLCDKSFETRPYLISIGKGKFCSFRCYRTAKVGSTREHKKEKYLRCVLCKTVFVRFVSHLKRKGSGKYCSRKCLGLANANRLTGSSHWNWKGGITPRSLSTKKYRSWRTAVFQRDGFKCVWCGYDKGRILEADHIKPWKLYPKLRFRVSNGRTLCRPCHMKTETWGGRMNSNKSLTTS